MKRLDPTTTGRASEMRTDNAFHSRQFAFPPCVLNQRSNALDSSRVAGTGTRLAVGGTADHVHLLVGLKSSHRLDYFLRDLKADSSEWIHREIGKSTFAWQKGYGAFSVSSSMNDIYGEFWRVFDAPE